MTMEKKIKNVLFYILVLTFFVPLVVQIKGFIFPFIVPKILLFRTLTLLALGLYLWLLKINWSRYRPQSSWLNWGVLVFYLSLFVSTFVGVDWYRSLWDNHERMLGLFTLTHYVIYYFILVSVFREKTDWQYLARFFLGGASLVLLIGVSQRWLTPDYLLNNGSPRVAATLGNPIYFSGYGLFTCFLSLSLLLGLDRVANRFWQAAYGAAGVLGILAVFLGGTRGMLVGLLVGLGILFVCFFIYYWSKTKIRWLLLSVLGAGLIISGLLFIYRQTPFVSSLPAIGRLLNSSLTSDSVSTRFLAWKIGVQAWQERPIFGWGLNNYYYAFNKYYQAEFLENGWQETWFDNAHNILVNTLATQGAVGILAYLALFGLAIASAWKYGRQVELGKPLVFVVTAFLVAHLVGLLTVFENPTSYLYFFFFLAMIAGLFRFEQNALEKKEKEQGQLSWPFAIVVGLLIVLLIYSTDVNPARANKATYQALSYSGSSSEVFISLYEKARQNPTPHIDDIRNDFGRVSLNRMQSLVNAEKYSEANKLFPVAYAGIKENLELHPLDIRLNIQLAQLALLGSKSMQDPNLAMEAEQYLVSALALSPERQQIIYTLSAIKALTGRTGEATMLLEKTVADDPKIKEGWLRLLSVYKATNQKNKALEAFQTAQAAGVVFTGEELTAFSF